MQHFHHNYYCSGHGTTILAFLTRLEKENGARFDQINQKYEQKFKEIALSLNKTARQVSLENEMKQLSKKLDMILSSLTPRK